MSLKDKIASILFGAKEKDENAVEDLPAQREQLEDESSEVPSFTAEDPALIKLPGEHPLLQLYGLRRKEAGSLPAPRLCMDEDGTLPEEVIQREKGRLQAALKNVCNSRMKSVSVKRTKKMRRKSLSASPGDWTRCPGFSSPPTSSTPG